MTDNDVDKTLGEEVLAWLGKITRASSRVAVLGKYIIRRSEFWKDMRGIMEKHGYPGGRMTRVHVLDLDTHMTFKVKPEGEIINTDFLDELRGKQPDFQISVAHFKDLFYIRVGLKPGYHNGKRILYPYTPVYAWAHDDIGVHGSISAANEVRGAGDVFVEFIARLPIRDLALICDMTGPELVEVGQEAVARELGLIK